MEDPASYIVSLFYSLINLIKNRINKHYKSLDSLEKQAKALALKQGHSLHRFKHWSYLKGISESNCTKCSAKVFIDTRYKVPIFGTGFTLNRCPR